MIGVGDRYFSGNQQVTRGQLAQVLKNLADSGAITINKSVQQPAQPTTKITLPSNLPAQNNIVTLTPLSPFLQLLWAFVVNTVSYRFHPFQENCNKKTPIKYSSSLLYR
ncbi:hypothetical protein [Brevibacillus laterosporus]|uniref:hypothetical protein n=1 Tax=Brevibacillus laterosporus TaxID=1465 RepID=UPI003D1D3350